MDMDYPCCNRHLAEKFSALSAILESIARQQNALGGILEAKAAKSQPFLVLLTASDDGGEVLGNGEPMESLMTKILEITQLLQDELSAVLADPSYTTCQTETLAYSPGHPHMDS